MGADLILAGLVVDEHKLKTLDWEAGFRTLEALSDEVIGEAYEYLTAEPAEDGEDRKYARELFQQLRNLLDPDAEGHQYVRDLVTWKIRGAWVFLSGGMSWGDSPTESFDTLNDVQQFPEVLAAIGFEV